MTELPQQLREICRWNQELVRENSRLHEELCRKDQQISELEDANAELCVERDAADILLDAAMARRP